MGDVDDSFTFLRTQLAADPARAAELQARRAKGEDFVTIASDMLGSEKFAAWEALMDAKLELIWKQWLASAACAKEERALEVELGVAPGRVSGLDDGLRRAIKLHVDLWPAREALTMIATALRKKGESARAETIEALTAS